MGLGISPREILIFMLDKNRHTPETAVDSGTVYSRGGHNG